jgi:hypothetical protein
MTSFNLHGFLAQTRVTISLDLSSSQSKISHSVVHALDLAAIFMESGHLTCIPTLVVPTLGGRYSSCLGLVVDYSLPTDAVLGTDWVLPCQPILDTDCTTLMRPHLQFSSSLPSPHSWYPIPGALLTLSCCRTTLIPPLVPVVLAQC